MKLEGLLLAAALAFLCGISAVRADDEGKEIPCSDTPFKFDVPGFTTKCKDYSRSSLNVDVSGAVRLMALHAYSPTEITFLDVVDDHIMGTSRVYYTRGSLESDIERFYREGDFSEWASNSAIGGYDVERVTVRFSGSDPMPCVAFRKLGAPRYGGVSGVTVGLACSGLGLDHATAALKHLVGE